MRFRTLLTRVRQSELECKIVCFNMERVRKVQKTVDDGFLLIIIIIILFNK